MWFDKPHRHFGGTSIIITQTIETRVECTDTSVRTHTEGASDIYVSQMDVKSMTCDSFKDQNDVGLASVPYPSTMIPPSMMEQTLKYGVIYPHDDCVFVDANREHTDKCVDRYRNYTHSQWAGELHTTRNDRVDREVYRIVSSRLTKIEAQGLLAGLARCCGSAVSADDLADIYAEHVADTETDPVLLPMIHDISQRFMQHGIETIQGTIGMKLTEATALAEYVVHLGTALYITRNQSFASTAMALLTVARTKSVDKLVGPGQNSFHVHLCLYIASLIAAQSWKAMLALLKPKIEPQGPSKELEDLIEAISNIPGLDGPMKKKMMKLLESGDMRKAMTPDKTAIDKLREATTVGAFMMMMYRVCTVLAVAWKHVSDNYINDSGDKAENIFSDIERRVNEHTELKVTPAQLITFTNDLVSLRDFTAMERKHVGFSQYASLTAKLSNIVSLEGIASRLAGPGREPFVLTLTGDAGVGKTTIEASLRYYIWKRLKGEDLQAGNVYSTPLVRKYHEGYRGQQYWLMDDVTVGDMEAEEKQNFLTWLNGTPQLLDAAAVDLKGRLFTDIHAMTILMNARMFPGTAGIDLRQKLAIYRRIDLGVDMVFKQGHSRPLADMSHAQFVRLSTDVNGNRIAVGPPMDWSGFLALLDLTIDEFKAKPTREQLSNVTPNIFDDPLYQLSPYVRGLRDRDVVQAQMDIGMHDLSSDSSCVPPIQSEIRRNTANTQIERHITHIRELAQSYVRSPTDHVTLIACDMVRYLLRLSKKDYDYGKKYRDAMQAALETGDRAALFATTDPILSYEREVSHWDKRKMSDSLTYHTIFRGLSNDPVVIACKMAKIMFLKSNLLSTYGTRDYTILGLKIQHALAVLAGTAIAACTAATVVSTFTGTSGDDQSQPLDPQGYSGKHLSKTKKLSYKGIKPQAQVTVNTINSQVRENMVTLSVSSTGQGMRQHGLFLGLDRMLLTTHAHRHLNTCPPGSYITIADYKKEIVYSKSVESFKALPFYSLPGKDVTIVKVVGTPHKKSIVKLFAGESHDITNKAMPVVFLAMDPLHDAHVTCTHYSAIGRHPLTYKSDGDTYTTVDTCVYATTKAVSGACGRPLIAPDGVVAIHVAGESGIRGFGTYVTRQVAQDLCNMELPTKHAESLPDVDSILEIVAQPEQIYLRNEPSHIPIGASTLVHNKVIAESISGIVREAPLKLPSRWKWNVDNNDASLPMLDNHLDLLRHDATIVARPSDENVNAVAKWFADKAVQLLATVDPDYTRPLSLSQNVFGFGVIQKLQLDKSCGSTSKGPSRCPKSEHFVIDGETVVLKYLQSAFDDACARLERGEPLDSALGDKDRMYIPSPKDELRSEVSPGVVKRVRTFYTAPLMVVMLMRKYLSWLGATASMYPIEFPVGPGISPVKDWPIIMAKLQDFEACFAGDFHRFDTTNHPGLKEVWPTIIDYLDTDAFSPEHKKAMKSILQGLQETLVPFGSFVFLVRCLLPSGIPLTSVLGAILARLVIVEAVSATEEGSKLNADTILSRLENLGLRGYGDDVMSASDEFLTKCIGDPEFCVRIKNLGMVLTHPDDKTKPPGVCPLSEVSFLSRSFVVNDSPDISVLPTLSYTSVYNMLRYRHNNMTEPEFLSAVVPNFLVECALTSDDCYEQACVAMRKSCSALSISEHKFLGYTRGELLNLLASGDSDAQILQPQMQLRDEFDVIYVVFGTGNQENNNFEFLGSQVPYLSYNDFVFRCRQVLLDNLDDIAPGSVIGVPSPDIILSMSQKSSRIFVPMCTQRFIVHGLSDEVSDIIKHIPSTMDIHVCAMLDRQRVEPQMERTFGTAPLPPMTLGYSMPPPPLNYAMPPPPLPMPTSGPVTSMISGVGALASGFSSMLGLSRPMSQPTNELFARLDPGLFSTDAMSQATPLGSSIHNCVMGGVTDESSVDELGKRMVIYARKTTSYNDPVGTSVWSDRPINPMTLYDTLDTGDNYFVTPSPAGVAVAPGAFYTFEKVKVRITFVASALFTGRFAYAVSGSAKATADLTSADGSMTPSLYAVLDISACNQYEFEISRPQPYPSLVPAWSLSHNTTFDDNVSSFALADQLTVLQPLRNPTSTGGTIDVYIEQSFIGLKVFGRSVAALTDLVVEPQMHTFIEPQMEVSRTDPKPETSQNQVMPTQPEPVYANTSLNETMTSVMPDWDNLVTEGRLDRFTLVAKGQVGATIGNIISLEVPDVFLANPAVRAALNYATLWSADVELRIQTTAPATVQGMIVMCAIKNGELYGDTISAMVSDPMRVTSFPHVTQLLAGRRESTLVLPFHSLYSSYRLAGLSDASRLAAERAMTGYTIRVETLSPAVNASGGDSVTEVLVYARMKNVVVNVPNSEVVIEPQMETGDDTATGFAVEQLPEPQENEPGDASFEPDGMKPSKVPRFTETFFGDYVPSLVSLLHSGHDVNVAGGSVSADADTTNDAMYAERRLELPLMYLPGDANSTSTPIWNWIQSAFALRRGSIEWTYISLSRGYLTGDPKAEPSSIYYTHLIPRNLYASIPTIAQAISVSNVRKYVVTRARGLEQGGAFCNPDLTRSIQVRVPYYLNANWLFYPPVGAAIGPTTAKYPSILPAVALRIQEVFYGVNNTLGSYRLDNCALVMNAGDDYALSAYRPPIGLKITGAAVAARLVNANASAYGGI